MIHFATEDDLAYWKEYAERTNRKLRQVGAKLQMYSGDRWLVVLNLWWDDEKGAGEPTA